MRESTSDADPGTSSQPTIVIRILGDTTIALACALTLGGIVAGVRAARRDTPGLHRQAEWFAYIIFGLITVATGAMLYALVTHDFSVSYVAQVGSRSTPLWVSIVSLWSALEGSLLFWAFVLSLLTALVAWRTPRSLGAVKGYTLAVLMGIGTFFFLLLVIPASPFMPVNPVPLDGPGPNPLLQNHWLMVVHPPLQYLGYVGMSVPFAFAMGSLLAHRYDSEWIRVSRNWMLAAWGFLTLAVVAGMWWSYEVLGWGGYWAWDPVENAAFMPWLTATAYLHSVMVQERRGMLKVWNLNLIIATFALTILGTFLTRSGIISSVHAFSSGPIGYWFLGFIGVILVFSYALLAGRSSELSSEGRLDGVASRDTAFLVNNMVLTAFTFTVLLGTMFPLVAEIVRGVKVSVGAPFFNQMTLPLMVMLLFLMGVGPALPWRRASAEEMKRKLGPPTIAAAVVLVGSLVFRVPSFYASLAFAFAAFAFVSNGQEYVIGARARMRAHGENVFRAIGRLTMANRHRYGGYIAHFGVIAMAVGIAASSAYRQDHEFTMRPGETVHVSGYDLRFDRLWAQEEPRRFTVGADVAVSIGGREVANMTPRLNFYQMRDEPIPTPHVRSRMTDLYLNLMAFERDGSTATIAVFIEPLVVWIWIGGAIIGLGVVIAGWPQRPRRPQSGRVAVPIPKPAARPQRRRQPAAPVGGD
jgi:cytochrome c-type biogenesis protein CcmF